MSFYVFQRSIYIYILFVIFWGDIVTCFHTHFILVYVVISVLTFFHDIYIYIYISFDLVRSTSYTVSFIICSWMICLFILFLINHLISY